MIASELIARYETMWHLSQQMLTAAKQAEWERLVELEQTRAITIEELKREDKILWQTAEGTKKETLIRAIMAADAEVKTLTESWMEQIQETLGSMGTEKKLKKAYTTF